MNTMTVVTKLGEPLCKIQDRGILFQNLPYLKYCRVKSAQKILSGPARMVLEDILEVIGKPQRKYFLVDLKSQFLEEGTYPCIPGWHVDCVQNLLHNSRPDIHHLVVFGDGSLTEFLEEDAEIFVDAEEKVCYDELLAGKAVKAVEPSMLYTYGRSTPHRAGRVKKDGWRVLIRVTQTDVVRGVSRAR